MSSLISQLSEKKLISPPKWLPCNTLFEGIQGSTAYGVAEDTSDWDIVGFCIPPKEIIFPHIAGIIEGFGRQQQRFICYQKHHVFDQTAANNKGRSYDLTIYNIVHYFHLCLENNPNMIDSLFLPVDCILHMSQIGNMIREKRHIFLHKGCWHRFKGYAYSQMSKIQTKSQDSTSKRSELITKYGFDTKFAYHLVRLMFEVEQLLTTGDLNLRRNSKELKAIRNGDWSLEKIQSFFQSKEKSLEQIYENCNLLPYGPREQEIKQLLFDCLETHYGSLENCIFSDTTLTKALKEISEVVDKYRSLIS
jgi:predicted nucleotidyltransferase